MSARLFLPDGTRFVVTDAEVLPAPGQPPGLGGYAETLTARAEADWQDHQGYEPDADCARARWLAEWAGGEYECDDMPATSVADRTD